MAVNRHKTLTNLRGANKEAQGRYFGDVARRERAANILHPHEVAGDYDAGRMLGTTLGSDQVRAITHADLKAFRKNVGTAGKQFKGGITAKDVINMSLPEDREKSNKQIRTAIPVQSLGGRVHFITNAGPDSEVTRHHVHIELMAFSSAVSSPAKTQDAARAIALGPLKFDCDCQRHTYWFRYIATIGRFNAGRDETGYPKIRNPALVGVACKHVLRVMVVLSTPTIRLQIEKMVLAARGEVARTSKLVSVEEAESIARKQEKTAHFKKHLVESTAERAERLASARAMKAVAEKVSKKGGVSTPSAIASTKRAFSTQAGKLLAMGKITNEQYSAMMAAIK